MVNPEEVNRSVEGKPSAERLVFPRGMTIRQDSRPSSAMQVAFSFRGADAASCYPPRKITQTAINLAGGLRGEIGERSPRAHSDYGAYFPKSAYGPPAVRRRRPAENSGDNCSTSSWRSNERQVANGKLRPSALVGYTEGRSAARSMRFWAGVPLTEGHAKQAARLDRGHKHDREAARNLLTPLRTI